MKLYYYRKSQYGVEREFLVESKEAGLIRELTGQKTIDSRIRFILKNLGFEFEEVPAPHN